MGNTVYSTAAHGLGRLGHARIVRVAYRMSTCSFAVAMLPDARTHAYAWAERPPDSLAGVLISRCEIVRPAPSEKSSGLGGEIAL